MDGSRLRLTGVGEGFTTLVSTTLSGVDSPAKVLNAVRTLFPEADRAELEDEPVQGRPSHGTLSLIHISEPTRRTII